MSKQVRFHEMEEGKKYKFCGNCDSVFLNTNDFYVIVNGYLHYGIGNQGIKLSNAAPLDFSQALFEEIIEKKKVEWYRVTAKLKGQSRPYTKVYLSRSKEDFLRESETIESEFDFIHLELVYTEEV